MALVTGGSSGIGEAAARVFARTCAHVVVADIVDADARTDDESTESRRVTFAQCDVTQPSDVDRLITSCIDRFGRLDFVHNNAAIRSPSVPLHELSVSQWDSVMDANLRGAWLVLKFALLAMRPLGTGAIVNTASVRASVGIPGGGAYAAAKAGLVMLTRVAALENADRGIRVNAVAPGLIATPRTQKYLDDQQTATGPEPMRRMGTAEEVAEAVVWLCSDHASYVNGACLVVDGGWTAGGTPRIAGAT